MPCAGIEADQNEPGKVSVDPGAIASAIPVEAEAPSRKNRENEWTTITS